MFVAVFVRRLVIEGLERLISAEALREVGREGIVMTVLGDSVPEEEKPNE